MLKRNEVIAGILSACSLFLLSSHGGASQGGYAGVKSCRPCHERIYDDWTASGHASILRKASDPRAARLPLPAGFARKNISYIIGGYRWKTLYLDKRGNLITSTMTADGRNQYNVKSRTWSSSLSGRRVPYDCGRCHTTGYSGHGHQPRLPGVAGSWQFDGVQCEACHGPGSRHVRTALKGDIATDRAVCTSCHETQPPDLVPVSSVFLAPYTEANQLLKSAMKDMACVECHDPHRSAGASIRETCASCHRRPPRYTRTATSSRSESPVSTATCRLPVWSPKAMRNRSAEI